MKRPIDIDEELRMFDKPENVKRLLIIFFIASAAVLLIDLVYHRHSVFAWEDYFGFYAVFGFVACVVLVIVSKYILRPLTMRKEEYYDD
jgi:hypothetical protein